MVKYDIAVIGAGPGGYVAAIKSAKMGAKTLIIEADEVGGICLNRGCIPTKVMVASANLIRNMRHGEDMGVIAGGAKVDFRKVIARKSKVVSQLVKGIHQLIKGNKIDLISGLASLNPDKSIQVEGQVIFAKDVIIATGSTWREISGFERDSRQVLFSDDILNIEDVPRRLCIIGGGVIGSEFASIFRAFGSEVTIIEAMENIIPTEDTVTSKYLAQSFRKQGIRVITGETAKGLNKGSKEIEIALSGGDKIVADKLLIAVGRKPNIEGIGIENVGIRVEKGAVMTDEKMRTSVDGIYAVGDINGKYMLAHKASREGIVAVEAIMGKDTAMDYSAIPRPIYTYPEVCCVGALERELTEKGTRYKTGRFSYGANSKAICDGTTEGQVVIYSEEGSGRILGTQIIGSHATEIGAELTVAIQNRLSIADLSATIHSHPTLSEIIHEAAEDCEGQAIHKIYK